MQANLLELKKSWEKIAKSRVEEFHRPSTFSALQWPETYAEDLGVPPSRWVTNPLGTVPAAAYLLEHAAARELMCLGKAKNLLQLDQPRHTREIVALHYFDLLAGMEEPLEIWRWFESTSGLWVDEDETKRNIQVKFVPTLITNLIWKVKMALREKAQPLKFPSQSVEEPAPEPYLDTTLLAQDHHMDINYVAAFGSKGTTFYKKDIDGDSAKRFAEDVKEHNLPFNPYTGAAICAACDARITPGCAQAHYVHCEKAKGSDIKCPRCSKRFLEPRFLNQHRALHCRSKTKSCAACKGTKPCGCQTVRDTICAHIRDRVTAEKGTESIYDLDSRASKNITKAELLDILQIGDRFKGGDEILTYTVMEQVDVNMSFDADLAPRSDTGPHSSTPKKGDKQGDPETCLYCPYKPKGRDDRWKHIREKHSNVYVYRCDSCARTFETKENFEEHQEKYVHTCTICDKHFDSKMKAIHANHTRDSTTSKRREIECNWCGMPYEDEEELQSHIDATHPSCQVCFKIFSDKIALRGHVNNEHGAQKILETDPGNRKVGFARREKDVNQTLGAEYYRQTQEQPMESTGSRDLLGSFDHGNQGDRDQAQIYQRGYRREASKRQEYKCIICRFQGNVDDYIEHMRNHPEIWTNTMVQAKCRRCPYQLLESVAATIRHYMERHPEEIQTVLTTIESLGEPGQVAIMTISSTLRQFMGQQKTHKCEFVGCFESYPDDKKLELHKHQRHGCQLCGWVAAHTRELEDHVATHNTPKEIHSCSRCGRKTGSVVELMQHEKAHRVHKCANCGEKFLTQMKADHHELSCQKMAGDDVFAASDTTNPLMMIAQCVSSLSAGSGQIDQATNDLIQNQLKRAKVTEAQKNTKRTNFKQQKTFTFITLPNFGPQNVVTTYQHRDIMELDKKYFSGGGTAEDNYTRLADLIKNMTSIIEARNLTENTSTVLLLKYLKDPARIFAENYQEEYESKYGITLVPPFEDMVLYLEANFVRIQPTHAKEQLQQMKKAGNESILNLFIRAQRCAHFASFTITNDRDRKLYRAKAIKETLVRNMTQREKEVIEKEELARDMRGEIEFNPRQVVEHLRLLKFERDGNDLTKNRVDYTTVGLLATTQPTIPVEPQVTPKGEGPSTPNQKKGNGVNKPNRGKNPGRGNNKGNTPRGGRFNRGGYQNNQGNGQTNQYDKKNNYQNTGGAPPSQPRNGSKEFLVSQVGYGNRNNYGNNRRGNGPRGGGSNRGGKGWQNNRPQGFGQPNTPKRTPQADPVWVKEATQIVGSGCFKCGMKNHGHRDCRTYKFLSKRICQICKKGYHIPKGCRSTRPGGVATNANRIWINPAIHQQQATGKPIQPKPNTAATNRVEVVDEYYQALLNTA